MGNWIDIVTALSVETTLPVKIWMVWMGACFMGSVFFVRKHIPARIALVAAIATLPAISYIWSQVNTVHLFGVAHLLIWLPLAVYLWDTVLAKRARLRNQYSKPFIIWAAILVLTISVSLFFDIRDIMLVIQGVK